MVSVFHPGMSSVKLSRPVAIVVGVAIALGGGDGLRAQRRAKQAKGSVVVGSPRSHIDWTRGLIVETGAAAGELRAPSPAVARVAALRRARQAARARLHKAAVGLSLAEGAPVSERVAADASLAARLDSAVQRTLDLDVDYSSDGSVVLSVGLPLEAVRGALAGATAPPGKQGAGAPSAIIVDASGALKGPVLGLALAAGTERYAGPTVFYASARAAARDPRLGPRKLRARAARRDGGLLWLAGGNGALEPAALASAREAGALVVVLLPK